MNRWRVSRDRNDKKKPNGKARNKEREIKSTFDKFISRLNTVE